MLPTLLPTLLPLLPMLPMLLPLLLMATLDMLDTPVFTKFVFNILRPKTPSQPRQCGINQRSRSPHGGAETTCDNENLQSD